MASVTESLPWPGPAHSVLCFQEQSKPFLENISWSSVALDGQSFPLGFFFFFFFFFFFPTCPYKDFTPDSTPCFSIFRGPGWGLSAAAKNSMERWSPDSGPRLPLGGRWGGALPLGRLSHTSPHRVFLSGGCSDCLLSCLVGAPLPPF